MLDGSNEFVLDLNLKDETSPHFSVNDLIRGGPIVVNITFGTTYCTTWTFGTILGPHYIDC